MLEPTRQPGSVSLRGLIPSASFVGCADVTVSSATEHSHHCTPGCLFAALPGTRSHGRDYVKHALLGGAAAILTDRPLADVPLPQCIVPDARQVYGRLCHALYAFPSQRLGVAGVTGTNGKTTTTWIVRSLLESASHPTGVIGTIEYNDGLESQPSTLTTPDALTMARALAAMRERHTGHAAIELSSHALKQGRAAGLSLDVAIVTNITHDHFDYHGTFHDYLRSKARIAGLVKRGGLLVLNADDPNTENILERLDSDVRVCTFGLEMPADIQADAISMSPQGSQFRLTMGAQRIDCVTPLVGRHNISNCLAAAAAAAHFGLSLEEIAHGLAQFGIVPGRLERVDRGQDFQVYVDYAHTDDALRRVISSVRSVTSGRVIVCFGAGGDRDRAKRPLMGRAASIADEVILTSDNPRSENPYHIIDEILSGIPKECCPPTVVIDRRDAIVAAIQRAAPGDAVIIAGKGHEKEQVVGGQSLPLDDVAVCREALMSTLRNMQPHRRVADRSVSR
ncbi:UDP-N-acetylmuramoyl-L-alanyl-D-glutamate--2,6-diaminopimelate ligase [Planctomicrobium piriforme]|uniref:UDP-N-acetylmuramoyl-L-alanyl-D-glutamate--2,6-diaminopimelate ligase n=1 Tax=Planctomicrobium piriforme TaxID=1576369 RepID=A0A1I3TCC5_9PLAN|nr:UDP-N-acetylmuramoyl-L-alanyl-D-glutamate--2,6-diaminopimelate ligase [Planctomicrobium piriforme]SFJ67381.1 UDP-N-acetylmuramoyl-L-alanyl-D-glutamate--2,6-diaminopimelate ligase [Planctomicrobium piriforme]